MPFAVVLVPPALTWCGLGSYVLLSNAIAMCQQHWLSSKTVHNDW